MLINPNSVINNSITSELTCSSNFGLLFNPSLFNFQTSLQTSQNLFKSNNTSVNRSELNNGDCSLTVERPVVVRETGVQLPSIASGSEIKQLKKEENIV